MKKVVFLLTLLALVPATVWCSEALKSPVPTTVKAFTPAPAKPAEAALAALFATHCEANLACQSPYIGYLHCEGEQYCLDNGYTEVDCDGHVQTCQCGFIPPEYCP